MHTNKCLATVETPAVFYAQWFPTCPCAGHLFQVCSQFSSHNLFDSLPICFSWYLLFSLFISVAYSTYSVLLLSMLVSNPCSVAISHWFHSWCKLFPFICHHLLVSSLLRANLLPQVTQDFECIRTVCKPMCIERFSWMHLNETCPFKYVWIVWEKIHHMHIGFWLQHCYPQNLWQLLLANDLRWFCRQKLPKCIAEDIKRTCHWHVFEDECRCFCSA